MKIVKKVCVFLLTFLLLAGCGQTVTPTETTQAPEATVTTEPVETTTANGDVVTTQQDLAAALKFSNHVALGCDIQLTAGVELSKGALSGNGYTLFAPTYDEDDAGTTASIFLISGTVENISLIGGNRSMSTDPNHRMLGNIRLNNVMSDAYSALYVGHGDNEHNLDAINCQFYGKTVFSRLAKAYFADCTFGYNSAGTQGCVWAYRDATFLNCRFEGTDDAKFGLIIPKEEDSRTVILENCYVGDTLITQENLEELLDVNNKGNNTIRVVN